MIGEYTGEYIGRTMCGFEYGNRYKIKIDKDIYGYQVSSKNAYITYASENSLVRNWIIDGFTTNNT